MGVAKKDLPDQETLVARYRDVYINASEQEKLAGMQWYARARQYAETLASGTDYTLEQMCALLAVVSPGSDWSGKNDTVPAQIVRVHARGHKLVEHGPTGPDSTWPFRNYDCIRKAQRTLDGDVTALSGNKVEAFAANISGDCTPVTIDGWMSKIALGRPDLPWSEASPNSKGPGAYAVMADALRTAAQEMEVTPAQFQAVVWESYRRKHTKRKV